MKKQLAFLGALFLACGTSGTYAYAAPAPQEMTATAGIVKGTVVDEKGQPVIGASIQEIGTTRGTATDIDGNFSLKVGAGARLQVSYVGYKSQTLKAANGMKIALKEDNALLDEVVVVGYGQQKKVNLTGAVATVDLGKTMQGRPEQDVTKALQGAVPGLTILNSSGDINSEPSISIRGLGTLSNGQKSNPLIVVDGVPVDDLSMVNSSDIASISVLKDAASSSIYGTRAAFGVILITTKSGKKGEKVSVNYSNNFAWDNSTYLPDFPDVPTQLQAAITAKKRAGGDAVELFGMQFDDLLPYAQKWKEQNGGKKLKYGEMRPYVDENNVGDYRFLNGKPLYYADFDIRDIWYQNAAPSQSHNLSVQGSSGRTTFFTSFNYDSKEDIMKFNPGKRKKYSANANVQTDITDWLTVGTRINFTRRHFSRADSYSNIYQYLWRWGSFFIPSGTIDGNDFRVVAMQKQAARKVVVRDQLRLNAYLKANITKDLTFNADFTYEIQNMNSSSADNSVYGMNWNGTTPGYIVNKSATDTWRDNSKRNMWTANAYLNYNKTFNDVHNLGVMLGINGEDMYYDYFYAQRPELYSETMPELNLTYGDEKKWVINSNTQDRASAGYFGRINYDYKGIYLLELNGRYDGSSRFPEGNKWAFFPSFSVGYRFSQEAYWDKLRDIVDNGKLRLSYGEIGNEAVGDWMFLSKIETISKGYVHWLNSSNGKVTELDMPTWVSPSLTWERIRTTDVGLDLGFLNDQITLGFDWYQRDTRDMLAPGTAVAPSVGATSPYTNAGSLRSRGWELNLNLRRQFTSDLSAYLTFSIGDAKAKVTKWTTSSNLIGHPNDPSYAYEGMNWGDIWGFETDRYFTEADFNGPIIEKKGTGYVLTGWKYKDGVADQTGIQTGAFIYGPGDIKYKDLDGNGKIDGGDGTLENHGDLKVIGNTTPRYEYSFHLGGAYKGFDLDLFFQGVGKRDMWTLSSMVFPEMRESDLAIYANQTNFNEFEYNIDQTTGAFTVTKSNISQGADFPVLYPGSDPAGNVAGLAGEGGRYNYYPQSKYLVDMSYLRLKNVTLGYTLPTALTKKAYIQKLRLYASVNNLCLLHKGSGDLPIDPEMNEGQGALSYGTWGRTYPITRSWSFGLQVTF